MFNIFKKHKPTSYVLPCGKHVDVLKVYRQLLLSGVDSVIDKYKNTNPHIWCKAEEEFVALIRKVFNLAVLSEKGEGYSDTDVLNVYDDFMSHIEKKDKKGQSSVTFVQPTVAPQDSQMNNNCTSC
jgi:hypothetical protein